MELVLGKYKNHNLIYQGHVSSGVKKSDISGLSIIQSCPLHGGDNNQEGVIWVYPYCVCTIEYMPNTKNSLRQAVFKGVRDDMEAMEVLVH